MNISNKSICILPQKLGLGGPASFQASMIRVLEECGIAVTHDPLDPAISAILLIGGTKQVKDVHRAQKAGVRVVQRLNGMNWVHRKKFTGVRHFIKAEYGNLKLSSIRRTADHVIYQSEFSRGWWNRVYRPILAPDTVIHNGVDLELFSPGISNLPEDHFRILLVEGHLGGGYEQGLLTAIQLVRLLNQRMEKRTELMVAGDVPETLRQQAESMGEKVTWCGVVKHESIPEVLRSAHLLFSADINAACPNSVIEAMACGLPVIAFDTGAMRELITPDCGRIADYGGDVWNLDPPDVYALADAAREVILERGKLSAGARRQAEQKFDIRKVVDSYLDVLLGE